MAEALSGGFYLLIYLFFAADWCLINILGMKGSEFSCLSCDTPSDPNTMPPLIQAHDGLKRLPPTRSQTVNKHIAT